MEISAFVSVFLLNPRILLSAFQILTDFTKTDTVHPNLQERKAKAKICFKLKSIPSLSTMRNVIHIFLTTK